MITIKYIELKTGYHDDGPAWIGRVKMSRSGNTVYFNDHAFVKQSGVSGNYIDIESGDEYWISGVKKNGEDRHWAGNGKIIIDSKIIPEYLEIVGDNEINKTKFIIEDIEDVFPIERINLLLNRQNSNLS
ncbi:MAG: mannose-1-phosphate guanylyltransferase [Christensenellaceae bacterium]|nr:mannose-1-phosphate guanylyltransferase [Christensenellaceae bacterium]